MMLQTKYPILNTDDKKKSMSKYNNTRNNCHLDSLYLLIFLIIDGKGQLLHLAKVILDIHVNSLPIS